MIALLLLSLALTGCIVEPYDGHGSYYGRDYGQFDRGQHRGDWGH